VSVSRVRAVTWNIRHGRGSDHRQDLGRVARGLASLDADLIGLQEVDRRWGERSGWADQPAELAEALGLSVLFAAALRESDPAGPVREYGLALLSRAPARLVEVRRLPGGRGSEPRVLLEAEVEGATVLVTHLEARSSDVRRRQAAALAAARPSGPAVLLADLNASTRSPDLAAAVPPWTDAWRAQPWARRLLRWGGTHPARLPLRRIDAVLVSGDVAAESVRVARLPGSDHLPVVADLAVGTRE
jgi:endonuclease/exonuclease/phosphatase family metal-dependent hydrolase